MKKVLSMLLSITILMGYCAFLVVPVFADTDENISSAPETSPEICEHVFSSWTDTGDGHTQTCSKCGINNTQNHVYLGGTVTVQPTCGSTGVKTVSCHVCGATKEETVAPLGNHTLTNLVSVSDMGHSGTCSVCGLEAMQPHTWDAGVITQNATCKDAGSRNLTCTGCQHTKTETIPPNGNHTFSSLTSLDNTSHKGTCTICNQELTLPHNWDLGTVDKPATCIEAGQITYACTGCHLTKTETLEMLTTHEWTRWLESDELLHKRICTVCQLQEIGEHSFYTQWSNNEQFHYHECAACGSQTDIKEHFPGPEATDKEPQLCLICEYVITPALNHAHAFEEQWTNDRVGHWHNCPECEVKGEYAEHDFENDCDTECDECGYTRKTSHDYSKEWAFDEENHYHECEHCGDQRDKKPHALGADAKSCQVCGYELIPDQETTEAQNTGSTAQAAKKKPFPAWGALIIAGVAAALIPIFAFFQRDDDF